MMVGRHGEWGPFLLKRGIKNRGNFYEKSSYQFESMVQEQIHHTDTSGLCFLYDQLGRSQEILCHEQRERLDNLSTCQSRLGLSYCRSTLKLSALPFNHSVTLFLIELRTVNPSISIRKLCLNLSPHNQAAVIYLLSP